MGKNRKEKVAEIRGYIKVRYNLGLSVKRLCCFRDKQMSFSTVYRWFTKFSFGQESVKDALYSDVICRVFSYFKHHVYSVSINNFIYYISINNFLEQYVYNNMLFMSLILD